ncbi:hypothetical protein [Embleya sp. NBC_00888]|uniref:hypothetical protein n=1 Tax=Embleya sp. NBC_00888 TaxID=2975960 RepID=UPI00386D15E6
MSAPVAHVALTDTPRTARELLLALGLRHLAVVDPGTGAVVGLLSDRELAEPQGHRATWDAARARSPNSSGAARRSSTPRSTPSPPSNACSTPVPTH